MPLFVFNLVETVSGTGRFIHLAPSLLDALHIPYTGSGTEAMFLTSHKLCAKRILKAGGLPTPEAFTQEELKKLNHVKGQFIIKSLWEHASVGLNDTSVVTVESASELAHYLNEQASHDGEYFAEAYIEGREFNLSLLASDNEPLVLPPAEIRFDAYPEGKLRIVDYRAKWEEDSFEYQHTPRSFEFPQKDKPLLNLIKDMARTCWKIFGLHGYARVDFRIDSFNRPWILEVNANPCISPDSGFFAAATQAGLSFNDVVLRIIKDRFR
jgi:D-alanine-D-alanine ligase